MVLERAKTLKASGEKLTSNQVLTRLLEGGGTVPPPQKRKVAVKGKDGQVGEIKFDTSKKTVVASFSNIDPKRFNEIEKALKAILS